VNIQIAPSSGFYRRYAKRIVDLAMSISALVLLSPVLLATACAVRIWLGSPVLFRQQRPGLHGRPFVLYKFRTMTDARDTCGSLLPDKDRLTKLGRFLRATSLDELPELINVLRGEMSIVGPRPLLIQYLDRYTPEQARRHQVRPGITGWAQINGRQSILFSKRLELDVWYVDHVSASLDSRIILLTIPRAMQSSGVILGQDVADVDDLGLSKPQ
jgi:sugar transferase EpsL